MMELILIACIVIIVCAVALMVKLHSTCRSLQELWDHVHKLEGTLKVPVYAPRRFQTADGTEFTTHDWKTISAPCAIDLLLRHLNVELQHVPTPAEEFKLCTRNTAQAERTAGSTAQQA